LLEAVVLLQQRIKNEDMAAKWRNEDYTSNQTTRTRQAARDAAADAPVAVPEAPAEPVREPIVVGGGPIE
jgi:NADH-quinone oxidoreductase subunit B